MNNLLVMKFGGTSVGSAARMKVSAGLAMEAAKTRSVVVVVSAMSKITDLLLDTMKHAEAGDPVGIESNIATLRKRHREALAELLPVARQGNLQCQLDALVDEFERIANGMLMLGDRPIRS